MLAPGSCSWSCSFRGPRAGAEVGPREPRPRPFAQIDSLLNPSPNLVAGEARARLEQRTHLLEYVSVPFQFLNGYCEPPFQFCSIALDKLHLSFEMFPTAQPDVPYRPTTPRTALALYPPGTTL